MCLIVFSVNAHAEFPLIVAANRDEFYRRPTRNADFWPDNPNILAGRDMEAGGTWLGLHRAGRFAAVTNVRNGRDKKTYSKSRGNLVVKGLTEASAKFNDAARKNKLSLDHYDGFNLIYGDPDAFFFLSNRGYAPAGRLSPGIYGLSNASLDTPWPKVDTAKHEFSKIIRASSDVEILEQALLHMMSDQSKPERDKLPDTGVGENLEWLLSSRFIRAEQYGTRSTSIILYHKSGRVHFIERNFQPEEKDQRYAFSVENG